MTYARTGLGSLDLVRACRSQTGVKDTWPEEARTSPSSNSPWLFLYSPRHSLDTAKQDSVAQTGKCQPVLDLEASQAASAPPVAAAQQAPAAHRLTSAASLAPSQTNGMLHSKPDGQQGLASRTNSAQPTPAEQAHYLTLETVVSYFEKQDPDGFFRIPVTEQVAPNYFSVIKHPMCFQRMRERLHAKEYRTFFAFTEDFELVCTNAMKYNQKRSRVHRSAVNLLRHGKKHLNNVQLEATRAIHMLHPEGPTAAAQEESAVNKAASAPAATVSNANKLSGALDLPVPSRQLSKIPSGIETVAAALPLADLQTEYLSDEDPAYSSFSGEPAVECNHSTSCLINVTIL